MQTRAGEAARPWFRTERYYHTNEGWWFLTRENTEEGPFATQHEAENELMLYVRQANQMENYPTV